MGKREMLVTSIFSFSNNDFKRVIKSQDCVVKVLQKSKLFKSKGQFPDLLNLSVLWALHGSMVQVMELFAGSLDLITPQLLVRSDVLAQGTTDFVKPRGM